MWNQVYNPLDATLGDVRLHSIGRNQNQKRHNRNGRGIGRPEQLGLSPILMGAANSSGAAMGKMIDAQSIVVASTATNWFGHEGSILRFVFGHSIVLACLVAVLVMRQAYVFTGMIVH